MAKKPAKVRVLAVRKVLVVPEPLKGGFVWFVRMMVPGLPFTFDSRTSYATKAQADVEAERWRERELRITLTPR